MTSFEEAVACAAASTPNVVELLALRLHDAVLLGRRELDELGRVSDETWAEIDRRCAAMVDAMPEENPSRRGKTLRGGPPAFGRRQRIAGAGQPLDEALAARITCKAGKSPKSSDSGLKYPVAGYNDRSVRGG